MEYGNTDQIAVAVADLVRHGRDPVAIRRRAADFAFPRFKQRLAAALNPDDTSQPASSRSP